MRIAILGTRGIPNHYGGYDQYAENLALGLAGRGHQLIVYNSHNHPYQKKTWKNVSIVHVQDNEYKYGSLGRFVYNFKCVMDIKRRGCDIIFQLDYTTVSIWNFLIPKRTALVALMDNLSSKKLSHAKVMGSYLRFAERFAAKYSTHLISDSEKVSEYLRNKFGKTSTLIPYAVNIFDGPDDSVLKNFNVGPYQYDLLIAGLVKENELEIILDGVVAAGLQRPFIIVGNHHSIYARSLIEKYSSYGYIRFLGGIHDNNIRDNLRYYSNLYFHPNTTSSTNVLLLHAMSTNCLIIARKNILNAEILGKDCFYFENARDITQVLLSVSKLDTASQDYLSANHTKMIKVYNWSRVLDIYEKVFRSLASEEVATV